MCQTSPGLTPEAGHAGRLVSGLDPGSENQAFNVLKTTGCNLEPNFGDGKRNLSSVLGGGPAVDHGVSRYSGCDRWA